MHTHPPRFSLPAPVSMPAASPASASASASASAAAAAAFRCPHPIVPSLNCVDADSSHGSTFMPSSHSKRTGSLQGAASQPAWCSRIGCRSDQIILAATKRRMRQLHSLICCGHGGRDPKEGDSSQEVDISVFRFTLGIPGLDDSELPRLLGLLLGTMLVFNHFLTLNTLTSSQLRSETVGILLAIIAVNLPFLGRRLKGAKNEKVSKLHSTRTQIFVLDDNLKQGHKEELAWASYALLRNTKIIAMMFWFSGKIICARGYWNIGLKPEGIKELDWLQSILKQTPFYSINGQFYLPNEADAQGWSMMLPGTVSLFGQTFVSSHRKDKDPMLSSHGLLVVSDCLELSVKDRTWIALLGKKVIDLFDSERLNFPNIT